jgi:hypothetical protein
LKQADSDDSHDSKSWLSHSVTVCLELEFAVSVTSVTSRRLDIAVFAAADDGGTASTADDVIRLGMRTTYS